MADLAETPGGGGQLKTILEDLALLGGPRVYGLRRWNQEWLVNRDGPGPPCMVCDREGCRERIGGRPVPTRMIAATVTVTLKLPSPIASSEVPSLLPSGA